MPLSAGARLGPYEILAAIGAGGMGEVYKARDTRLGRDVAIKVLPAEVAADPERRHRFELEARAVSALNHPHICVLHDIGSYEGTDFLVMEYLDGQTLAERLRKGALPRAQVLDLGAQIADALASAHRHGIVHRDLKPANIMLTKSGTVRPGSPQAKLLDFGLAKLRPQPSAAVAGASVLSTQSVATRPGMVMGTVPYMAPEQLEGKDTDARTDLFAFGCVLYEMLTGRRAFGGNTEASVIAAIMTGEPEPLSALQPLTPPALDRLVRRCLAKDPDDRWQHAADVAEELRGISQDAGAATARGGRPWPFGARAASSTAAPTPSATTHRWRLGAVMSLSVVAVVALVFWYQGKQPALSFAARDWVLVSDFENLTGDSIFDKSLATALNVSLSQSVHANVFSKGRTSAVLQRMGKKPDAPVDEQVGREVCQRENIRALICPSIGKVGNTFVITARIVDPQSGDGVRSYAERADDYNHILPALDAVAASVRKGLGESLVRVQASSRPLAKVTTSSLTALKSYSEAQELWGKGQYKAAVALDESAVKEDPDFAMAHAALGVFYASFIFHEPVNAKAHFEKALGLVDRTTEREKMVIRLQYQSQYGTPDSARNLFEAYLRAYPDSIAQRYNYAGMLRDHQELDRAVQQYKEVIRLAPDNASAFINLATTYSAQDKDREALATYDRAFRLEPAWATSGNLNHEYGFTFVSVGEYDKARAVFTQALATPSKPSALRSLALLDLYLGKYRDAKPKLAEAILLNVSQKSLLSEARNHLFMAIVHEGEGDPVGIQRELDKAARCLETLPPQPWLSARIAVGYARGRNVEKAAGILGKVRKDTNPNDPAQNSELHRLEGEVEFARGNQARGLELLALADREQHGPLSVESLARAQRLAGKTGEATGSYEIFLDLRGRSDGWEPQRSWFQAHGQLASLYIARKEPEKARRVLQELLDLWKDADPDLPVYKEARRLLGVGS